MRTPHKTPDTVAIGRMGAADSAVGVLHPAMRESLADFRRLNTEAARAAFADRWIRQSGRRLEEVWPMLYELLAIVKDQQLYAKPGYLEKGQTFPDFEAYFEATMGQPFAKWKELEDTYHFVQKFAPGLMGQPYSEVVHAAEQAGVLLESGVVGNGRSRNDNIIPTEAQGTDPTYLARRLLRDAPQVFERLKAGEYPSVYAAALAAGVVSPRLQAVRTPEGVARAVRHHFTPEQIAELVRLLTEVPE